MSDEVSVDVSKPLVLNTILLNINGREVEIPLRRPKRTISLRVDDSVVYQIDKTIVKTQFTTPIKVSRTMLISKVVEALGILFSYLNNEVDSITITARNKNMSQSIRIKLCSEC